MDKQITHGMMKIWAIIVISVGIGISAYFASKGNKKASFCAVIVAILAFLGPYIVVFVDKVDKNRDYVKEFVDSFLHSDSNLDESIGENRSDSDLENSSISNNGINDLGSSTNQHMEPGDGDEEEYEGNQAFIIFVGESHNPSDSANIVEVSDWIKNEDFDLLGKTYDGGVKITIYNTSYAYDSNNISMEIVSEAHYVLDANIMSEIPEEHLRLEGKFVVGKDTNSIPSTAVISILVDGEEVYNSGKVDCYSGNIEPFDIMLAGKKELIIRTVCQYRGEPFVVGLVDK